jgi:hypothetical protein
MERNFDDLDNGLGWKKLPMSSILTVLIRK